MTGRLCRYLVAGGDKLVEGIRSHALTRNPELETGIIECRAVLLECSFQDFVDPL